MCGALSRYHGLWIPHFFAAAHQRTARLPQANGERVYGAVEAPGWILPAAAVGAIGTALLPVLLAPGEDAFSRQQEEERTAGMNRAKFGRRK